MQSPDNHSRAIAELNLTYLCTAVGERKQNGNERLVPPGRMIRDKEGGIGDVEGMAKRDTNPEE